jgi:plasmid stability protein
VRTTINLDDELLRAAKIRAAETNRTLTAVVEDALRLALQVKLVDSARREVGIPTSGSGGLLPGVELDDTSALLDRMEERA